MKFSLTKTTKNYLGTTLFQIKAEKSFGNVSKGDLGGWVEKEENLSQEGNAWVSGNACVSGDAKVYGNALVYGDAWVSDYAKVSGNALVFDDAKVYGYACVFDDAKVYGNACVFCELKLSSGYFFGVRCRKEEIKYKKIDDDYELIYKGEAKFGEDEANLSGRIVKVELDGKTYEAVIK